MAARQIPGKWVVKASRQSSTQTTALALLLCMSVAQAEPVKFAVIGDLPYNRADERNLQDVLADIERSDSRFVIHLGDIKSGSEHCGDALLDARIRLLESSAKPLVYIPGDNEWTDCHRRPAGQFDPVERLRWLRQRAFSQAQSLGQQRMPVAQQGAGADAPSENLRWQQSGVLWLTFNVPGSNNNYWAQHSADDARNSEFTRRRSDNAAWLSEGVTIARHKDIRAVVVAFQGNPFERDSAEQQSRLRDGFMEWRQQMAEQFKGLGKPVLLIHGDTHSYRIDQALSDDKGKPIANVTRLEAFGYPFTRNWVEVTVDTSRSNPFTITPQRLTTFSAGTGD